MSAGLIYTKIPKIMKDIGAIGKNSENTHQKYKFRGIEAMYNSIQPVLIEHGVFCVPQVLDSQCFTIESVDRDGKPKFAYRTLLKVSHKFYAEDGSFVDVITVGEGIDSSDKASPKAHSGAMKYAFIESFSIPTEDVADADKDSPEAGKTLNVKPASKEFGI